MPGFITKNTVELLRFDIIHLISFYSAVNKLITDKTQTFFSLTAEHSDSMKYSLNKQLK